MIGDIWTVMRKELKEFLLLRGPRGPIISIAIVIGMFGIFLPLQAGPNWFSQPTVIFYLYLPCMLVMSLVADSFAGERERHTLETLLASRLSDQSILWGKAATVVGYAWGSALAAILAAFLSISIRFGPAALAKSPMISLVGLPVGSLLVTILMTSIGVLLSMKMSVVKQVQQTIGLIFMGIIFIPIVGSRLLPRDLQMSLYRHVTAMGMMRFGLYLGLFIAVIDIILVALTLSRFKRARLVFD